MPENEFRLEFVLRRRWPFYFVGSTDDGCDELTIGTLLLVLRVENGIKQCSFLENTNAVLKADAAEVVIVAVGLDAFQVQRRRPQVRYAMLEFDELSGVIFFAVTNMSKVAVDLYFCLTFFGSVLVVEDEVAVVSGEGGLRQHHHGQYCTRQRRRQSSPARPHRGTPPIKEIQGLDIGSRLPRAQ